MVAKRCVFNFQNRFIISKTFSCVEALSSSTVDLIDTFTDKLLFSDEPLKENGVKPSNIASSKMKS